MQRYISLLAQAHSVTEMFIFAVQVILHSNFIIMQMGEAERQEACRYVLWNKYGVETILKHILPLCHTFLPSRMICLRLRLIHLIFKPALSSPEVTVNIPPSSSSSLAIGNFLSALFAGTRKRLDQSPAFDSPACQRQFIFHASFIHLSKNNDFKSWGSRTRVADEIWK